MVTTTVTVKFHQPTRERRREWQKAMRLYRDTKQYVIDGWENDDFSMSVTTSEIDNKLYSAIQNQAIREAKRRLQTPHGSLELRTKRLSPSVTKIRV